MLSFSALDGKLKSKSRDVLVRADTILIPGFFFFILSVKMEEQSQDLGLCS